MRVVIQRVKQAEVVIDEDVHNKIEQGLLIFLGVETEDTELDTEWLVNKVIGLRIFNDGDGVMNINVVDVAAEILVISQFTLHASTRKGNRPSYIKAAKAEIAIPLYEEFIKLLSLRINSNVKSGVFGADMKVALINDGPVTIIIDSKKKE